MQVYLVFYILKKCFILKRVPFNATEAGPKKKRIKCIFSA